MLWIRFKMWLSDNWFKWLIGLLIISGVVMVLVGIFAFMTVDSYTRTVMLAQTPATMYMTMLSSLIFVYMYMNVFRTGFGGQKKKVAPAKVNVRFSDVIGLANAKREAMEVVELLRDRAMLKAMGGQVIKGILFFGPPGTGKTLLAKSIATEAGIPFLSMSGSEFVEIFVGVGASRVRGLFKQARNQAKAYGGCLIFIDEIDAMGRSRKLNYFGGQESDSTLNQLLTELDGLNESDGNVVIIGATNAPEDSLDAALLRPGRFDRHVYIDRPNLPDRIETFKYYLKKVKHDPNLDVGRLARRAVGYSPADIMNICKESALIAMRSKTDTVQYPHVSKAFERIEMGVTRPITMTLEEKLSTAFHEAGHLVMTYLTHPTDDVFKATIIPRGAALGAVWHNPRDENHSENRTKLLADIRVSLAGFVAERIKYGVTTTGVSADFTNAMQKAQFMVWSVGMGTNGFVGNFNVMQAGNNTPSKLSETLKTALNNEVNAILHQCTKETEDFLRKEWPLVERFAHELNTRHELEFDDIHAIFNEYGRARQVVPMETVTVGEEIPNHALPPANPSVVNPGAPPQP